MRHARFPVYDGLAAEEGDPAIPCAVQPIGYEPIRTFDFCPLGGVLWRGTDVFQLDAVEPRLARATPVWLRCGIEKREGARNEERNHRVAQHGHEEGVVEGRLPVEGSVLSQQWYTAGSLTWNGRNSFGITAGVSGYSSSRYLAISTLSITARFVRGSYIAGSVYGVRALEFGGSPKDLMRGAISGYSTHCVRYGRPLLSRRYLGLQ